MKISEFGFQRSRSEAFCTGLFAQALSLSPAFSSLFLISLGYDSRLKLCSVTCEQQICNTPRRPDVWLTLKDEAGGESKPQLLLLESKTVSGESNGQLTDYGEYVDRINSGENTEYRKNGVRVKCQSKMPTGGMELVIHSIIAATCNLNFSEPNTNPELAQCRIFAITP